MSPFPAVNIFTAIFILVQQISTEHTSNVHLSLVWDGPKLNVFDIFTDTLNPMQMQLHYTSEFC